MVVEHSSSVRCRSSTKPRLLCTYLTCRSPPGYLNYISSVSCTSSLASTTEREIGLISSISGHETLLEGWTIETLTKPHRRNQTKIPQAPYFPHVNTRFRRPPSDIETKSRK